MLKLGGPASDDEVGGAMMVETMVVGPGVVALDAPPEGTAEDPPDEDTGRRVAAEEGLARLLPPNAPGIPLKVEEFVLIE